MILTRPRPKLMDPLALAKRLWPQYTFYKEQQEFIQSVCCANPVGADETYVPAGNMMGKDFGAGRINVLFALTRHPFRIVWCSATDKHLAVIFAETVRAIQDAAQPLLADKGGNLLVNHHLIRWVFQDGPHKGEMCPISYIQGLVASEQTQAALQGHHVANVGDGIPRTLFGIDECSSVPDRYIKMGDTWANRILGIGNTWECENWWKKRVHQDLPNGGNILRDDSDPSKGYHRRIIRITAEDSPNVKVGLAQQRKGLEPTGEVVMPGVKSWEEYQKNLKMWDPIEQSVKLRAQFYEGAQLKLFPPHWLNLAECLADQMRGRLRRAKGIGVDPAEGGDKTSMCAVDEYGIIELVSFATPDTSVIPPTVIAFMRKHGVEPEAVLFDRGGGGKEHADLMRSQGFEVNTLAFGETLVLEPKRGMRLFGEKVENREERYTYFNRRAQLYGELSLALDPSNPLAQIYPASIECFSIPRNLRGLESDAKTCLRDQLKVFPRSYDAEGRLKLPPKNKRGETTKEKTLVELIGHSPDEADATVLALHAMLHKGALNLMTAGVVL